MTDISRALQLVSVACIGVYTGAMLTEGFLNVPYWRSLAPSEFFSWYAANDRRLIGYFRPLTSITALVALLAAVVCWWTNDAGRWYATLSAVLLIVMIVLFFAIFREINESFAHATVAPAELPDALRRWGTWHTVRILLSMVALASSLLSLSSSPR